MKLHTFPGAPNPTRIDLLLAEKNLELPTVTVDLTRQEQLTPAYRAKNPSCDVPMLELDDGTCISQVPALALYLDSLHPEPPLYGETPEQRAVIMMWEHLMFHNGLLAAADVLRNTSKGLANRALVGPHDYEQIPALAERGRQRVRDFYADLDARCQRHEYVAGDTFSMADITAWVSCNFAARVKEPMDPEHEALRRWHETLSRRPAFERFS